MTDGDFLWKMIIVTTAVMGLIGTGVSIWAIFRRNPPLPEELYRDFLRKADHEKMCAAVNGVFQALDKHNSDTHKEIFKTIREESSKQAETIADYQAKIHEDFQAIERGLGRVEGKLESPNGVRR